MSFDINSFFAVFPEIRMSDVVLREIRPEDANNFFHYINNMHVKKYLSADDTPSTIEKAREELGYWSRLFRYRHSIYWGIADSKTDQLIGTCGFNNWSTCHQRAEISYDLAYEYWGKGIMTRIIAAMCEFSFTKMNTNRIQATVTLENMASFKVLEKNGFIAEGMMRNYGLLHGQKKDFYMCGLIKEDSKWHK